jgi:hypothetical protein
MDNVLAYQLGEAARDAMKGPAGDLIDVGLILCRVLREKGFEVHVREEWEAEAARKHWNGQPPPFDRPQP